MLIAGALGTPSVNSDGSGVACLACARENGNISGVYMRKLADESPLQRIADTTMTAYPMGPPFHFFFGVSYDGNQATFTANVPCGEHYKCGIFLARSGEQGKWDVDRIAGACKTDTGIQFDAFGDAMLRGDTLAFVAQTSDGREGLYKVNTSSPQLEIQKVVWSGDTAPGSSMGEFAQFPQPPSIYDGELVFRAYTTSGDTGIYHANRHGNITELVTTQDKLEGDREVVYMGSAESAFDGNAYAFYASTVDTKGKNGHDGIYLGYR